MQIFVTMEELLSLGKLSTSKWKSVQLGVSTNAANFYEHNATVQYLCKYHYLSTDN